MHKDYIHTHKRRTTRINNLYFFTNKRTTYTKASGSIKLMLLCDKSISSNESRPANVLRCISVKKFRDNLSDLTLTSDGNGSIFFNRFPFIFNSNRYAGSSFIGMDVSLMSEQSVTQLFFLK